MNTRLGARSVVDALLLLSVFTVVLTPRRSRLSVSLDRQHDPGQGDLLCSTRPFRSQFLRAWLLTSKDGSSS